ncbi:HlyD family efflux transporter periplasmic adaptor subunit [Aeoliella sp. ICT_H6.2]|uniref:HlyD family efflux transporter periplasmic adaptor subunit n=1 Tax=Aeoliella straminimaris TaxID=2954799 RepID=A0A9X2JKR5_9BACT|nr:HlyD family efflux transporter periplasmic adaptor subunit [Aeoliella straminimaris]MCO6047204.1 HlyD family efflux transporter periplasmic adaptor subunit [Aeoliella straminimaris]
MKSWLTWILIAVGLGLVGLIVWSFVPEAVEVDMATVERGTVLVTVDEDGKTRIREKYVVSTPLSGRLLRINMDPGDVVVAGKTLLATIEPRDPELLDARAIAQAEARVKAAEASVKKSEPVLSQARIDLGNAETYLARLRASQAAVMRSEIDDAEARFQAASEELRAAKYAQEIAEFELQQARAALLRSRPRDEENAGNQELPNGGADEKNAANENGTNGNSWNHTIRSPITGRVLRVFQESSAVVTAGMSLLELGDPSDLEVEIDVLSSDAVKIQPGARVMLEHWGGEPVLNGRVRLVEPSGFTKISTLGVEEQRVNVIVDLTDPADERQNLGDGFRVEARIVVAEAKDVLRIPASSLFRPDEGWAVFKVVDGRAVETKVVPGYQNGLEAEIREGLAEGDQVIIHPSDKIADGVKVRQR